MSVERPPKRSRAGLAVGTGAIIVAACLARQFENRSPIYPTTPETSDIPPFPLNLTPESLPNLTPSPSATVVFEGATPKPQTTPLVTTSLPYPETEEIVIRKKSRLKEFTDQALKWLRAQNETVQIPLVLGGCALAIKVSLKLTKTLIRIGRQIHYATIGRAKEEPRQVGKRPGNFDYDA